MEEQPGSVQENQRKERLWYAAEGEDKQQSDQRKSTHICLYYRQGHWGDGCATFVEGQGTLAIIVKSRGCFKCEGRHHTSI